MSRRLLISYLTLRRLVGLLGVILPALLVVGDLLDRQSLELRSSISAYYDSGMRDVFVGVLFVIGWFLFSYRGYESKDDWAGNLAGVLAMGVALCPSTSTGAVRTVHVASAAGFFLTLAYFSMVLFTKTHDRIPPTDEKLIRNRAYRICAVVILASLVLIAVYWMWGRGTVVAAYQPIFWLESLALLAFGFSWCVKGEILWSDNVTGGCS